MDDFIFYDTARAAWLRVPEDATIGTRTKIAVVYPPAKEENGLGQPCGAFGGPDVEIEYESLSATGMAWWQARISSGESGSLKITAPDDRTGTWVKWLGSVGRPTHNGKPSLHGGETIYNQVKVKVHNCTVTT